MKCVSVGVEEDILVGYLIIWWKGQGCCYSGGWQVLDHCLHGSPAFPLSNKNPPYGNFTGTNIFLPQRRVLLLMFFWKCLQRVVNELIYFICSPGSEFARGPGSKKEQRLQLVEERGPRKTKASKQTQLIGKPLEFPSPLHLNTKNTRSWLSQNSWIFELWRNFIYIFHPSF